MQCKSDENLFDRSYNSGESNPNCKLTEQDIRDIRCLHEKGARNIRIAEKYKVSPSMIHAIIHKKAWKNVD